MSAFGGVERRTRMRQQNQVFESDLLPRFFDWEAHGKHTARKNPPPGTADYCPRTRDEALPTSACAAMRGLAAASGDPMCAAMKRKRTAPLTDKEKELKKFYGRLTAEDRKSFAAQTEEEREMRFDLLRAINRPWEWWDKEVARRHQREQPLQSKNEQRQRNAERDYQEYRDIARKLCAEGRASRRTTLNRLADLIQKELIKDGRLDEDGKPVHIRTITRALSPKK